MSAAGMMPEELKPNCPNDVISMNVRFCCATVEAPNIKKSMNSDEMSFMLQKELERTRLVPAYSISMSYDNCLTSVLCLKVRRHMLYYSI